MIWSDFNIHSNTKLFQVTVLLQHIVQLHLEYSFHLKERLKKVFKRKFLFILK